MKLTDLDAEFFRWAEYDGSDGLGKRTCIPHVATLAEAQGVIFDCPVCRSPGHSVMVGFRDRGVPAHLGTRDLAGNQTLWQVSGTGLHDLTLQPSVDCTPSNPKCWHGFVTNGSIT